MSIELRVINLEEDKSNPIFVSDECQQVFEIYRDYYPQIGFHLPWVGYFVIRENIVVGACGFNGQPHGGKVEISYWTFDAFQRENVATFACRELIKITQNTDPKLIITAKTAPEKNASTKILEKNGFIFKEIVQDHEIGDAWLWQLTHEKR